MTGSNRAQPAAPSAANSAEAGEESEGVQGLAARVLRACDELLDVFGDIDAHRRAGSALDWRGLPVSRSLQHRQTTPPEPTAAFSAMRADALALFELLPRRADTIRLAGSIAASGCTQRAVQEIRGVVASVARNVAFGHIAVEGVGMLEAQLKQVVGLLARHEVGGGPAGHGRVSGPDLSQLSGLQPHVLNDCANLLEQRGWATVFRYAGTAPYKFSALGLSAQGRLVAEQLAVVGPPRADRVRVVFAAASPEGESSLALDVEHRGILEKLRASAYPDSLEIIPALAVRADDLLQLLNEREPHVLHLSGHASKDGKLALVGADGNTKLVTPKAMSRLFKTLAGSLRVVLVNACHGAELAKAVVTELDFAIGPNTPITNLNAQIFAASFYRALGFGRSIQDGYDQGCAALSLEEVDDDDLPVLFSRDGVSARDCHLLRG